MPTRPNALSSLMVVFAIITTITPLRAADPFPLPTPTRSFTHGTLRVDQYLPTPAQNPQSAIQNPQSPPLILLPGLFCGPWVFHDTIRRLSPTHTLYALTLPGFDAHPAAPPDSPLFQTVSNDLWSLLSAHQIKRPILIGHSLGGTLAISLATQHPDRLSAIVSIDGLPVFPAASGSTPDQRAALATQMAAHFASLTPQTLLTTQQAFMQSTGTRNPDLVTPAAQLMSRSDPKAIAHWIRETLTTDLRPDLPKITLPILVLMPHDPTTTPFTQAQSLTFYQSLLTGAPHATVHPISPSRHFPMLDQPEPFHDALTQFLSSLPK